MIWAVSAGVLVFLLVVALIKVNRQRQLLREARKYEKLLRECRVTRWHYTQSLEKSREAVHQVMPLEERRRALKAELHAIRGDLHRELQALREAFRRNSGSDLDQRVISQQRFTLNQKWKLLDSRRKDCLGLETTVRELASRRDQAVSEENRTCQNWVRDKERVMELWRGLHPKVKITDPQKFLH